VLDGLGSIRVTGPAFDMLTDEAGTTSFRARERR
jgi:hypothetical protein